MSDTAAIEPELIDDQELLGGGKPAGSEEEPTTTAALVIEEDQGLVGNLMDFVTNAINEVDEKEAAEQVAALRQRLPEALPDEIIDELIKQKCRQAGAVGAITSGAGLLPGLGTVSALTFGVAADIGMTFKLQAELVLEIAAAFGHQLNQSEKRNAVLLVTGMSAGANQVLTKAGRNIAVQATERLAERAIVKAIPVLGVAGSAGANIVSTYIIGRRAQAYFSLGQEAMGDWGENIRTLTGLDERRLTRWLAETTENSWHFISNSAQDAAQVVIVASLTAGETVSMGVSQAGKAVIDVGKVVARGAWGLGKRAGGGIAQSVSQAGESVSAGASRAKEAIADAGRNVAAGAGAIKDNVAETAGRVFRRNKDASSEDSEEAPLEEEE